MSLAAPQTMPYRDDQQPGIPQLVDVSMPQEPAVGAVLVVHGGAFLVGHRRMKAAQRCVDAATSAGLAALSIDYRMVGRGGGFEASLDDVLAALDWWRDGEGAALPLALWGLSAGAALVAAAAAERAAAIRAVVGIYGPYDFTSLPGWPVMKWPARLLLGTTAPEEMRATSPLERARFEAPLLLVHGRQDRLVPIRHSRALHEARQEAGLPSELVEVDDRHGFLKRDEGPGEAVLEQSVSFLCRHLPAPAAAAEAAVSAR